MDTTQSVLAYGTLSVFVLSIAILIFGNILTRLSPSVQKLQDHQNYLSDIILKQRFLYQFRDSSIKNFSSSPLNIDYVDHKIDTTKTELEQYNAVKLAQVIEIVNYSQREISNITSGIRVYAFILAIGAIITFLVSLPEGQQTITFKYVVITASHGPLKALALTDLLALLFISHRYYLELQKINDLTRI